MTPKTFPLNIAVYWVVEIHKVRCELAFGNIVAWLGGVRSTDLSTVSVIVISPSIARPRLLQPIWVGRIMNVEAEKGTHVATMVDQIGNPLQDGRLRFGSSDILEVEADLSMGVSIPVW